MNTGADFPSAGDDVVDLRELIGRFWAGKWIIGGIALGCAVIAAGISLLLPNVYRAEALLAPRSDQGFGTLSSLSAQYGDLASLAGISLGTPQVDRADLGIEILRSRKFIGEFILRHDLLVPLMASTGWDAANDSLRIDPDDYDVETNRWVRDVDPPKSVVPSLQEAYEEFQDIFSVSQNNKTGFISVSIDSYSPSVARQWVDWLVEDINSAIMQRDVKEAEQAIAYLEAQIENTSLAGLQTVFFSLIEEQTKVVMLANVSDEYLFETIDPAVVPEEKYRPSRVLVVLFAGLLGGIVGMFTVLLLKGSRP